MGSTGHCDWVIFVQHYVTPFYQIKSIRANITKNKRYFRKKEKVDVYMGKSIFMRSECHATQKHSGYLVTISK